MYWIAVDIAVEVAAEVAVEVAGDGMALLFFFCAMFGGIARIREREDQEKVGELSKRG